MMLNILNLGDGLISLNGTVYDLKKEEEAQKFYDNSVKKFKEVVLGKGSEDVQKTPDRR